MNKKIFVCLCAVFIVLIYAVPVYASSAGLSWYCKRTADHKRPPAGSDIAFVNQFGGYYIDNKCSDEDSNKIVYLTFDAGYENGNIERILDVLKRQNTPGAFFVLGNLIEKNTDLVNRMFAEGHLVCNHTYSHKCMVGVSRDFFYNELTKLENVCKEKTGNNLSKFYRPPEGRFDKESLSYAQEMGYKTVFWSFAYADWDNGKQMNPQTAKKKILDNVHNGAVILLHPTSKTNADILEDVIIELKSQGYRFGTLEELCK